MQRIENDCVGCDSALYPCNHCGLEHVTHYYCDDCGDEAEKLYVLGNKELCESCVFDNLEMVGRR